MTKSEALRDLNNANVGDYSTNQLINDPKALKAFQDELAIYYAPGPNGERLSDDQLDERQKQRLGNLLEASQHGD